MIRHIQTDVLIIGGGTAAAIAALELSSSQRVVMLSKDQILGGASIQTSGGISLPGIAGEPLALFVSDTMQGGSGINDPAIVKTLAQEGADFVPYMESLGVIFDRTPDGGNYRIFKKTEGHSVMRNYMDRRNFHEFARVLKARLVASGVGLYEHTMAFKTGLNGRRISHVAAYGLMDGSVTIFWPSIVILATGGYGRLYGVSDNSLGLTGDGQGMALACGARLRDMEMVQFIPLAFPYPSGMRGAFMGMCSLFGPETRLYNGLGERFMEKYDPERKEFSTRDEVARGIYRELQAGRGTARGTVVVDPTGNDRAKQPLYCSSAPTAYAMVAKVFGAEAAAWEKPFEAIPSQHFCMGGIYIDKSCRTACPNLLAAGEATGGAHGANRLGGNALLETVVFGRIAARTAREDLTAERVTPPAEAIQQAEADCLAALQRPLCNGSNSPVKLKKQLGDCMWNKCGIIRSGRLLTEALDELDLLADAAQHLSVAPGKLWNQSFAEALELPYMLRTARAVMLSALARKESRGAHYREDFPNTDEAYVGSVVVSDVDGELIPRFESAPVRK